MNAAHACLLRVIKLRVVVSVLFELLHALRCSRAQIIKPAEDNRFGRTNLRARGNEAAFLSIVTKRALKRAASIGQRLRPAIDYAERTRNDAITTAIANVVLHKDRADFCSHNRTRRTRFQAAGFLAMFANVRNENPAKWIFSITHRPDNLLSLSSILFKKQNVAPRRCAELSGVIVRVSRPRESVIRHFVPFLARHLACFAADAHRRVSEETDLDMFLYVIVPALVRALRAFVDHLEDERTRRLRPTAVPPLMAFCLPSRGCVKMFRGSVRREEAVRDANSPAVQLAARVARSNREKPGRAANDRARYCR